MEILILPTLNTPVILHWTSLRVVEMSSSKGLTNGYKFIKFFFLKKLKIIIFRVLQKGFRLKLITCLEGILVIQMVVARNTELLPLAFGFWSMD